MNHIITISFLACSLLSTAAFAKPPKAKCLSKKTPKAFVGTSNGTYEIPNGLSKATRSGTVGRKALKVTEGCAIEASPGESVLMLFPEKMATTLNDTSKFEIQCVDAKEPNGKFFGYNVSPLFSKASGTNWAPPCDAKGLNSEEKKYCSKKIGNTERNTHFKQMLEKKKLYGIQFSISGAPSSYSSNYKTYVSGVHGKMFVANDVAPSGRAYCQAFHKPTQKVLFKLEFDLPEKVALKKAPSAEEMKVKKNAENAKRRSDDAARGLSPSEQRQLDKKAKLEERRKARKAKTEARKKAREAKKK